MANSGRIVRGNILRLLQLGLDEIKDQAGTDYKGKGEMIFKTIDSDKAFYEVMQLAGMGMAGRKDEGAAFSFDSIDQHWVFQQPVYTYMKGAKITREALKDNKYENMMPRISRELLKSLSHAKDQQMANIFIDGFSGGPTYGDGKVFFATDHPVQAGGVNSNRLAVDEDLSEVAIENLSILCDNMVSDSGLLSEYNLKQLVIPTALKFEARRILKSDLRSGTTDNDLNALNDLNIIQDVIVWKRLSDADAFYATTSGDGLCLIQREGIFTEESKDPYTFDTIIAAGERHQPTVADHRSAVACPGA